MRVLVLQDTMAMDQLVVHVLYVQMVATRLQPAIVIRRAQLVPLDTTGRLLALRVMRIVILVLHHIMLLVELLLSNRDVVYVQMALIVIQMATLSLRVRIALLEPIG